MPNKRARSNQPKRTRNVQYARFRRAVARMFDRTQGGLAQYDYAAAAKVAASIPKSKWFSKHFPDHRFLIDGNGKQFVLDSQSPLQVLMNVAYRHYRIGDVSNVTPEYVKGIMLLVKHYLGADVAAKFKLYLDEEGVKYRTRKAKVLTDEEKEKLRIQMKYVRDIRQKQWAYKSVFGGIQDDTEEDEVRDGDY